VPSVGLRVVVAAQVGLQQGGPLRAQVGGLLGGERRDRRGHPERPAPGRPLLPLPGRVGPDRRGLTVDDHVLELSTHQVVSAGVDPERGPRVHDAPLPFAAVVAGTGVLDESVLGQLPQVEGAVRLRHAEDPPALGRGRRADRGEQLQ